MVESWPSPEVSMATWRVSDFFIYFSVGGLGKMDG